jgi:hypothetical protein
VLSKLLWLPRRRKEISKKHYSMVAGSGFLVWLGGLAAAAGGVLWSIKALIDTAGGPLCAPLWPAKSPDYLFVVVQLLFLAGIAGLYARYQDGLEGSEEGSEGGVAFALSAVGVVASSAGSLGLLASDVGRYAFGVGCAVECIGLMALGAAASRAQVRTLPHYWSVLPFVIGLLGIFSFPLGVPPDGVIETCLTVTLRTLFGLGWILVGYHLYFFSQRGKEAYSGSQ